MSKPSKHVLIIGALGILIVAVLAFAVWGPRSTLQTTPEQTAENAASQTPQVVTEPPPPDIIEYDEAKAPDWVKEALKDRVLGNPSAPVTIEDFSSLTCPHCADFHTEVLPQLHQEYIETGKVKLIFSDFPLNLPALQASALSRCIKDDEAYFAYLDQLYATQSSWGQTENARSPLLNTIKFTGLSREEGEKCIDDQMLISGILDKMGKNGEKHNIDSTPSFVLNGKTVIRGAQPYESFKSAIDAELAK